MSMIMNCGRCGKTYDGSEIEFEKAIPNGTEWSCPFCGDFSRGYGSQRCSECGELFWGPLNQVQKVPRNLYSFECKNCMTSVTVDLTSHFRTMERMGRPFSLKDPNSEEVQAFFYGLFMDESLLAAKGINPSKTAVGYVDGCALRIGRRATLVPDDANRAYGVLMTLRAYEVSVLYSDESVADYVPEPVSVVLTDGTVEAALCYNLPGHKLEGTNAEYTKSLLLLADKLGLPSEYLQQIRKYMPENR